MTGIFHAPLVHAREPFRKASRGPPRCRLQCRGLGSNTADTDSARLLQMPRRSFELLQKTKMLRLTACQSTLHTQTELSIIMDGKNLSRFFTIDESIISKLDHKGWLPIWRLKNLGSPDSAIVPIYALNGSIGHERIENAMTPLYAHRSLKAFQALPGFSGMVYCMTDRRAPILHKIGHSKNAWARMQQSPWRPELGRIPHQHREINFILACLSIDSRHMEAALHASLKHRSYKLLGLHERGRGRGRGRGREWFYLDHADTNAVIQKEIEVSGEEIWVRGLADSWPRHTQPYIRKSQGAAFVAISRAEQDFRAQRTRVFHIYRGLE